LLKNQKRNLTGAVGLITEAHQEEIISSGKADLVLFARESLRNPYLALTFAGDLNEDVAWPNSTNALKQNKQIRSLH
jgi:2,4-dienoyl-CoA reductase-like NADH-dependent reductase (Old Yellow Enzyme family)